MVERLWSDAGLCGEALRVSQIPEHVSRSLDNDSGHRCLRIKTSCRLYQEDSRPIYGKKK